MTCAIIQARMGSTRLPGKVLRDMAGKPLIGHLMDRLRPSKLVDQFIVATTDNPEDDVLASWCASHGIACFRGSDWDVLDRFYRACLTAVQQPLHVVRICCDNPLHHHRVLDFVIAGYLRMGVDYASNSNFEPDYLEDGFDTEVFSYTALERAWRESRMLSQREHVTPYIKNSGHFSCYWRKYDTRYTFKLSVDTEDDLRMAEQIIRSFADPLSFGLEDVTDLLLTHPGMLEANKDSKINEGYARSIKEDRQVYD